MRLYYLDTSALIKHYVAEPGSAWLEATAYQPEDVLALTFAEAEALSTDNPNLHP